MTESFAQREFGGADLGDRRLDARLVRMGTAAMARPDASLPKMMSTDAELEAT
ncbi:MAG: transposase DNA-binding-containing protein [Myxococcales bacterium]|nr:transposase DNA-binding-containing protein [Myxococcales bacterium]